MQAGGPRGLEIARLVADQDAVIHVDWETAEQVRDHSGGGLAPIALATISLDGAFRVIRAVFECIDMCAHQSHLVGHPAVQGMNVALLVETPCDARLIADDEREISGVVDCLDGLTGAIDPFQLVRLEDVARIMIQNAVAVEEDGRTP